MEIVHTEIRIIRGLIEMHGTDPWCLQRVHTNRSVTKVSRRAVVVQWA